MATMTMANGLSPSQHQANSMLNTLPDPRSPIASPDIPRSHSNSPHHPELSSEVATLSNKLIHAINHQTDLDDTLNHTRHELDAAHERIRELEHTAQEHRSLVANGILIQRTDVETDTLRLKTALADERKAKFQIEKEKKGMEQELESLTTALFEEANQMVANARRDAKKEREIIEKRNEQLQSQLNDAELLLASHQEQLAELKSAMQQRNEFDNQTTISSAPSTPAMNQNDDLNKAFEALTFSPSDPAPPTSFASLLHPVLRTDVQAYEDFHALLEISRRSQPASRVPSGTYSGLAGLGLGNVAHRESSQIFGRMASNASNSSLSNSNNHPSSPSPGTPSLPQSNHSSQSSREIPLTATPLKETPFYKRVLTEDVEPTLRLDLAPGLSWLARRGVISAILEGKLIVEPMPNTTRLYQPPCSLCGEQGRGEKRARKHKFRTSESDSAQRYPLCDFCLNRLRASCDFLGFLRMIKDGHWRTDGTEAEMLAWEESVRLRERMFWARIGGGVVPALAKREISPRNSLEEEKNSPQVSSPQPNLQTNTSKPEQPSPLVQESSIDAIQSGLDISSPIDPHAQALRREENVDDFETPSQTENSREGPNRSRTEFAATVRPQQTSVNRTTTRSRGTSRGESGLRPSAAQTVAQRAAMFDRRSDNDDAEAASRQLQSTLQASIRTSMKKRSPSKGRSQSPATPKAETEPPLPELPREGRPIVRESIPGSFDF